jgi:hypothetical protein
MSRKLLHLRAAFKPCYNFLFPFKQKIHVSKSIQATYFESLALWLKLWPRSASPIPLVKTFGIPNPFRHGDVRIYAKITNTLPAHNIKALAGRHHCAKNTLLRQGKRRCNTYWKINLPFINSYGDRSG